jgi:N-acetylneuraminic acid mutarotase
VSIGGIAGAVAGGVIGFFIGGPVGAAWGAAIGFGVGMAVDPIMPDIPAVGAPVQELQVTQNKIGIPCPDVLGTAKLSGNLLCYGKERSKEITVKISAAKGGDEQKQVVGHKYYMSWAVGICAGPVDELLTIFQNEKIVWEGNLQCPESGGQETITISDLGKMIFYFGTDDQTANSKVGELISDATLNTPYRCFCWAFFDDCCVGNYNRMPTMRFVVRKTPEYSFSSWNVIQFYDYNPMHAIWHILRNLTGLPESWMNASDFATVAETLAAEYRGVSILFDRQQSALSYLESINNHIDGILRYGNDGKFHPKLIRDDYTVGDLPSIDESVMLDEPSFSRKSWIDTMNEVKVQYSEIINVERSRELLDIWTQLDDFTYLNTPLCQVIDNMIYVGVCGSSIYPGSQTDDYGRHLRRFNPNSYSWETMADYPDSMAYIQSAVVNGGLYAGLGSHYASYGYTDIWCSYSPVTNSWTSRARPSYDLISNVPAVTVACENAIYILAGRSGLYWTAKWIGYSPGADAWGEIGAFPGGARTGAVAAAIGTNIYLGLGAGVTSGGVLIESYNDWWVYNTVLNEWTQLADFGGAARQDASIFVYENNIYVGCGYTFSGPGRKDWWKYNVLSNTWSLETSYPGAGYVDVAAAAVGSKIFMGLGGIGTQGQKDWWEYK